MDLSTFFDTINVKRENKSYYQRVYENKGKKWNWSAFLFGPLWFIYRRMYFYGLGLFTTFLIFKLLISFSLFFKGYPDSGHEFSWPTLIELAFLTTASLALKPWLFLRELAAWLPVSLFSGYFGSYFYYRWVQNHIKNNVSQKLGTNFNSVVFFIIIACIINILLIGMIAGFEIVYLEFEEYTPQELEGHKSLLKAVASTVMMLTTVLTCFLLYRGWRIRPKKA